jgi:diguanylate cyclase (GGDEF)-like protein
MSTGEAQPQALPQLADEIRAAGWDLALQVVQEGLQDDVIPSLARLGRLGQLGDMPTFVSELGRELGEPRPERLFRGSPLAALVRDHGREREALGFAPRDIVTEFLLLRRVLWRFVTDRAARLDPEDVLLAEKRLNDAIDGLVTECVVAYFDRATSELAYQARHDQLTDLLNHQAFTRELELELERSGRYEHGVTLVFFDFDHFKQINDTMGHPEGDRVLRQVAELLRGALRRSDLAGRMGGDEFAAFLVETDETAGGTFLQRLHEQVDALIVDGKLPARVTVSAGLAHFPSEADSAEALFKLADQRLYETKRAKDA